MLNVECLPRRKRGFTLIEVLIVVVIAAIAATIALPGFVRTMQGAQLRTASRTVLMAHKYARSTAVIRQTQMAMLLDRERMQLEIITMRDANADRSRFLDSRTTRDVEAVLGTGDENADPDAPPPAIETELIRDLGSEIKLSSFQSESGGQEQDGVFWIMYYPNGMSDGFDLVLADDNSRNVEISSDPISGKVESKYSRF